MAKQRFTCNCGFNQTAYAFCRECGKELPKEVQQRTSVSWEIHQKTPSLMHVIARKQAFAKFCPHCGENLQEQPLLTATETVEGN